MKKILVSIVCLALLSATFFAFQSAFRSDRALADEIGPHDLVVSPDGDDAAAGTLDAPLATLAKAKEKLLAARRKTKQK